MIAGLDPDEKRPKENARNIWNSYIDWGVRNPMEHKGTVAKLAMRQPFVLFKGLTFQKLCLPGAFRPGDHHNKC
ncbi:transcriptional regulator TetR family [Klebsiella pneumoniae]|uniref:Transcriptional regulator TetR family n=1 Tax=Klebsiella pneumoniae TaxID=573 RepID=A0A4P0XYI5_KLEPN|nr:transcriptional regulator TetR family [Klebsiella pneumoniae]